MISRGGCRIARGVGRRHAGVNVLVGHQVRCQDILAVDQCSVRAGHDSRGVGIAVQRQCHGVAHFGVAADGARDRRIELAVLGGVDDVVAGDGVDGDGSRGQCIHRDIMRRCGGDAVAGRVGGGHPGGDAGVDRVVSHQVRCLDRDVVDQLAALIGRDQTRVGITVDHERDGVAQLDVAAHRAADRSIGHLGLRGIDDVIAGDGVNGDAGGNVDVDRDGGVGARRGAGRSGRIGGGDTGVNGVVGHQVGCLDVHAVDQRAARTGRDRRCIGVAVDH